MQVIKSINFDSKLLPKLEMVEDYCKQHKISFSSFAVDALLEKLQKNAEALPNPIGLPQTLNAIYLQQNNKYSLGASTLDSFCQIDEKQAQQELIGNYDEGVNYKVKRVCKKLLPIAQTNLAKIEGKWIAR